MARCVEGAPPSNRGQDARDTIVGKLVLVAATWAVEDIQNERNRPCEDATIRVNYHLVILKKPYLDLILSGRKTIELRLTRAKRPVCGRVLPRDRLFLKVSAGPVCGMATVADTRYYDDLTPERIAEIKRRYNDRIAGDDAVWESMMDRKSGFLVWLADVRRIEPIRIHKKDWRAWVLLKEGKDFGLLSHREIWEDNP